jgi:hypothetical protein
MTRKQVLNGISEICLCIACVLGGYSYGSCRNLADVYIETHTCMVDYLDAVAQRFESTYMGEPVPYPTLGSIADLTAKLDSAIIKRSLFPTLVFWFGFWPMLAISSGIQRYIGTVLNRKPIHPAGAMPSSST